MKAFTLSYDDGVTQDRRFIELLNRYNLKCTFNLNSGKNPSNSYWQFEKTPVTAMDLTKCKALYAGHEIALHGTKHVTAIGLSDEQLEVEFGQDKLTLESIFDTTIHGAAYAFGKYDANTQAYLSSIGIQYARKGGKTLDFSVSKDMLAYTPTCHHADENLFDLAERFIQLETDEPQIFYLWGHSYEFDGRHDWDRIESFFKMISGHADIFYGTNYEVFKRFGLL